MTKFWDEYFIPTTIDEALELLARYDGRARVVAGGTDLFLDFKADRSEGGHPHYLALIDVTRIAGANTIYTHDCWIILGCSVTHTQIIAPSLIREHAAAFTQASGVVAGAQVRNVGTVVGNIAHALPAADSAIALAVLGAEVQVRSNQPAVNDDQWRPIASVYLGPGKSGVDSTRELIAAIRLRPTGAFEGSAFARVMRPQGIALPILGMAAKLKVKRQKAKIEIEEAKISAGPVAPVLFRATQTEDYLRGKAWSDEVLAQATQVLLAETRPRTSAHRATKEYRLDLLPTMLHDVMTRAANQAKDAQ